MPTQKASKGTRKLKQRQARINAQRVVKGKKRLPFSSFVGISRKRNRKEYESDGNKKNNAFTSAEDAEDESLKRSTKKPRIQKEAVSNEFGFGEDVINIDNEPTIQELQEDMESAEEDIESEGEDLIPTVLQNDKTKSPKKNTHQLKKEIETYQSNLEHLKQNDPEFYKHLKESGEELLKFGGESLEDLNNIEDTLEEDARVFDMEDDNTGVNGDAEEEEEEEGVEEEEEEDKKKNKKKKAEKKKSTHDDEMSMDIDEDEEQYLEDNKEEMMGHAFDPHMAKELTVSQLDAIIEEFESTHSPKAMKQIFNYLSAFVQLCIAESQEQSMVDEWNNHAKTNQKNNKQQQQQQKQKQQAKNKKKSDNLKEVARLALTSSEVFEKLLRYCITQLVNHLPSALKLNNSHMENPKTLNNHKLFRYNAAGLRRYLKALYVLFNTLSEELLLRLLLVHIKDIVYIIMASGENVQQLFVKKATQLWSSGTPIIRMEAYMFLYECSRRLDGKPMLKVFKYMYQAYVTVCKRVSLSTIPGLNFMMNGLAQIYLLNPVVSYQETFRRLRAVAFHVKECIQIMSKHAGHVTRFREKHADKLKRNKENALQSIYNWRFVNIMRLWAKVLASHASKNNSDMHLLYYPYMQIAMSVFGMSRSRLYDPTRIFIMESVLEIIRACEECNLPDRRIYVPLAPEILQIMSNPAFAKKTKTPKNKEESAKMEGILDLRTKLRVSNDYFNTPALHSALIQHCSRLLLLYYSHYSYSIAFPELSLPCQTFLQDFLANPDIPHYLKKGPRLLFKVLCENTNWINMKRKSVDFSPKDVQKVNTFLNEERRDKTSPLSKFIKSTEFMTFCISQAGDMDRKIAKKEVSSQRKQQKSQKQQQQPSKSKGSKNVNKNKSKMDVETTSSPSKKHARNGTTIADDIIEDLNPADME